ncbi:hypothetical protein KAU87_04085, partial [Candidatus Bathyarchaeota archaeon]|nr:hypothetical protein [Candidatus Bathyarchaeota archaeon]
MADKEVFQASPIHAFPILVSLLFGILCAVLVLESSVELETVLNFPEAGIGSLFIGVVFVLAAGVSATLI